MMAQHEKFLELSREELETMKIECEAEIKTLRTDIMKDYETVKPILDKMRETKRSIKSLKEKRDVIKTFLTIEKTGENMSLSSITSFPSQQRPIITDVFREPENDDEAESLSYSRNDVTPRANEIQPEPNISAWLADTVCDTEDEELPHTSKYDSIGKRVNPEWLLSKNNRTKTPTKCKTPPKITRNIERGKTPPSKFGNKPKSTDFGKKK
jgi:hypothetical protein